MKLSILGANGWIGSSLAHFCEESMNQRVARVCRNNLAEWLDNSCSQNEDHTVFYCIGLTSDFREKPHETIYAHVSLLSKVIAQVPISNFVYLSSTRIYADSAKAVETDDLAVNPNNSSDIYNLSKLLGEALVLSNPNSGFKVARVSNVLGPNQPKNTFVGQLLRSAQAEGKVTIRQAASTAKDYISIQNVVQILYAIALNGKQRIYNLARGENTSHDEVAQWLRSFGCEVIFSQNDEDHISLPAIMNDRILNEFSPGLVNPFSPELFNSFVI